MFCYEFPDIIVRVSLIEEGKDFTSTDAWDTQRDMASFSITSENRDTIYKFSSDLRTIGEEILRDINDMPKLEHSNKSTSGAFSTSLKYNVIRTKEDIEKYVNQQINLKKKTYSLLVEFMGHQFAIIRTSPFGDGFQFGTNIQGGKTTNTITITNPNGIQQLYPL